MHSVLIATQKPKTETTAEKDKWQRFLESVEALASTNKSLTLLAPSTLLFAVGDDLTTLLDVLRLMATYPYSCIFFEQEPHVHAGKARGGYL